MVTLTWLDEPLAGLPLVPENWPVLLTVPHEPAEVGDEMTCTVTVAPAGSEPWLQVRTLPVMEQPLAVVAAGLVSTVQVRVPLAVGRVSVMTAPVAVPPPVLVRT